jgi:hypothetical protein
MTLTHLLNILKGVTYVDRLHLNFSFGAEYWSHVTKFLTVEMSLQYTCYQHRICNTSDLKICNYRSS